MKRIVLGALAACVACVTSPAMAVINVDVPPNFYITYNGMDWAWASPCSATTPSCGDSSLMSFQGSFGWHLPSAAEFLLRPQASDFGTSASFRCATPYFSDNHTHCDYTDGQSGHIWNPSASNASTVDTWVVRAAVGAVPEPATWAMMLFGFGAIGMAVRRSRRPVLAQIA